MYLCSECGSLKPIKGTQETISHYICNICPYCGLEQSWRNEPNVTTTLTSIDVNFHLQRKYNRLLFEIKENRWNREHHSDGKTYLGYLQDLILTLPSIELKFFINNPIYIPLMGQIYGYDSVEVVKLNSRFYGYMRPSDVIYGINSLNSNIPIQFMPIFQKIPWKFVLLTDLRERIQLRDENS